MAVKAGSARCLGTPLGPQRVGETSVFRVLNESYSEKALGRGEARTTGT